MRIPCKTPFGPGFIIFAGYYQDDTKALRIVGEDGIPICTLTHCVDISVKLGEGLFIVKTWRENAEIAHSLLEQGIFEDTGQRLPTGNEMAELWKLKQ